MLATGDIPLVPGDHNQDTPGVSVCILISASLPDIIRGRHHKGNNENVNLTFLVLIPSPLYKEDQAALLQSSH